MLNLFFSIVFFQGALDLLRKRRSRDAVILQLSTEGLKIFDSLTEEPVDRMVLADITFSAPVKDEHHGAMFGIIAKDASLGLTACHIFELDPKGVQVCS